MARRTGRRAHREADRGAGPAARRRRRGAAGHLVRPTSRTRRPANRAPAERLQKCRRANVGRAARAFAASSRGAGGIAAAAPGEGDLTLQALTARSPKLCPAGTAFAAPGDQRSVGRTATAWPAPRQAPARPAAGSGVRAAARSSRAASAATPPRRVRPARPSARAPRRRPRPAREPPWLDATPGGRGRRQPRWPRRGRRCTRRRSSGETLRDTRPSEPAGDGTRPSARARSGHRPRRGLPPPRRGRAPRARATPGGRAAGSAAASRSKRWVSGGRRCAAAAGSPARSSRGRLSVGADRCRLRTRSGVNERGSSEAGRAGCPGSRR